MQENINDVHLFPICHRCAHRYPYTNMDYCCQLSVYFCQSRLPFHGGCHNRYHYDHDNQYFFDQIEKYNEQIEKINDQVKKEFIDQINDQIKKDRLEPKSGQ